MEKITNTYATNLKLNAPDPENMKKGVLAGLFHKASIDDSPNHKFCPKGESSWCHYKFWSYRWTLTPSQANIQ